MRICNSLIVAVVLTFVFSEVTAIGLSSIFGSRKSAEKSVEKSSEDSSDESLETAAKDADEYHEHNPHHDSHVSHHPSHKPTHPPLLPAIPHPADHPLHPANNPNHPLNPENFPTLPHPLGPKETIHATKTVFVEVTDRVTTHPVCMTVYGVKPPCLPYHHESLHQKDPHHHKRDELEKASVIKPTATAELLEPTRILAGVSYSETPEVEGAEKGEDEAPAPVNEEGRSARYLEVTPSISALEEVEIKDEPTEGTGFAPIRLVESLLNRQPVTHYKTKTLWVTKVEKVIDSRVTATLEAKNCIPTDSFIPLCHSGEVYRPGYHPEGTYTEGNGGNLLHNAGNYHEKPLYNYKPIHTQIKPIVEHHVEHHGSVPHNQHAPSIHAKSDDDETENSASIELQ